MSGADMETHAQDAQSIDAIAADWLMERQDRDNWNEKNQAELDAWLAQSLAHRIAFLRLEATWGRTERLVALRRPTPDIALRAAGRRSWPLLAGIAASVALIAVIGAVAANMMLRPQDRTYTTPVGGRELVSFADGSQIELNTDTVLRTRMNTGERTVWLDRGEAYFRVHHDSAHPFVVIAGKQRITDLGTKFFIRRETGRLEVALLEGKVRFSGAKSALMNPGDEIVAAANRTSLSKKSVLDLANELGWRRGVLVFRHTTLADAAAEFNRYNSQKIAVADADAAQHTIDGTFLTNDLEDFTDAAQTIFGLHVKNDGKNIVISR
jgi:transmembrane sensor